MFQQFQPWGTISYPFWVTFTRWVASYFGSAVVFNDIVPDIFQDIRSKYPLISSHNQGKSPFSIAKSTVDGHFLYPLKMVIFHMLNYPLQMAISIAILTSPEGIFQVYPHGWLQHHGWSPAHAATNSLALEARGAKTWHDTHRRSCLKHVDSVYYKVVGHVHAYVHIYIFVFIYIYIYIHIQRFILQNPNMYIHMCVYPIHLCIGNP